MIFTTNQRLAGADWTDEGSPASGESKSWERPAMKFAEGKAQGAAQPCRSKVPFNGPGEPEFKRLTKEEAKVAAKDQKSITGIPPPLLLYPTLDASWIPLCGKKFRESQDDEWLLFFLKRVSKDCSKWAF